MSIYRHESELLSPVAGYVHRKGFRWQRTELPFYEYRIDLYGYSRVHSLTVAIELKLRNWKRALEQGIVYQLTADWVFAAMPRKVITTEVHDAFAGHGVGLIGVSDAGRCVQLLLPQDSGEVRDWYRKHYISLVCNE